MNVVVIAAAAALVVLIVVIGWSCCRMSARWQDEESVPHA